jgi:hypothetical protein
MIRFVSFDSHAERIWGGWDRSLTFGVVADGLRVVAAWLILALFSIGRAAVATYRAGQQTAAAYRGARHLMRRQWRLWAVAGAAGAYEAALRQMFANRMDSADKVILRAAYLWQDVVSLADAVSGIRLPISANAIGLTVAGRTIRLVQVVGRQVYFMGQPMV